MSNSKLTDSEIKKSLEYCSNPNNTCDKCILFNAKDDSCQCASNLRLQALDLINHLQAKVDFAENLNHLQMEELQSLKAENKRLSTLAELGNTRTNDYRVMRDRALKAEAENERLKSRVKTEDEVKEIAKRAMEPLVIEITREQIDIAVKLAKAEAYKEFAKLLDKEFSFYYIDEQGISSATVRASIKRILKELVGEDK